MYSDCIRLQKLSCDSLTNIEKWLQNPCQCQKCQIAETILDKHISNMTITRHPKFTHENLLLTSKMIIKIQLETMKQQFLKSNENYDYIVRNYFV